MASKKEKIIVLTPKTDAGRKKLDYHGERWLFRHMTDNIKFSREPGPWYVLMSRDGKKVLHVKQDADPDFDVRDLG